MEWIVVTARTIDEAKELALDRLGVIDDELEFEVLEEPRPGLFGRIGRSDARIRARVRPISREKPGDRRRRGRSGTRRREKPADARRAPQAAAGSRTDEKPASRRRRGGRTRVDAEAETVEEHAADVPVGEQADMAREFTEGLIDAFGARAVVRSEVVDDVVLVDVEGDKLGLLVGHRGSTLAAVEELVRSAVQRRTGGHSARVNVDVGGYRRRRREALEAFARQQVEEVRATGVERALEPMPASDRKVVHDVVAEIEGVSTVSEGEEPRRRVVIRRA